LNSNKSYRPLFYSQVLLGLVVMLTFNACKTNKTNTSAKEDNKSSSTQSDKQLTNKQQTEFEYAFFNANREKILGNYALAESNFLQALKVDQNSAATIIYSFQNKKDQAFVFSKRAAMLDPKNIWYQLLYTEALKENKKYAEAASVYQKLITDYPDRIDFYYELANAYLILNKPNDALKIYDKIETRIGITEDATMQKLKIYKSTKNVDKSIEEAKKIIKAFPKEAKYYGMLGEIYIDNGMNDKAMEAYNDLLKIDPTNAYVHLSLADYYRNNKQNEKAFDEIEIAFKSKELDIDTKVKILLSYYSITETYTELKADADELCKIIVAVHPEEAKAFAIYGDFLIRDKKYEEARIQYRKAIELDKEKFAVWNQLLAIEAALRDFSALEKESKEAIELFPNQASAYYYNGIANTQLKNPKKAVDVLTEGKEFVYGDKLMQADFYASIGDAQNQLKNNPASDSAYDKALELNPANDNVLNNYAYYLSLRNVNLEKAETMSKKSNELEPNNSSYEDTYGWILYQMKKYEDAKIWIGKALEHGGKNNGTLLEHYGDVLYQLGDTEKALLYWIDAKKSPGASEQISKKIMDKKVYE
jgi:tetratricopeptide (TPR) repeat protein